MVSQVLEAKIEFSVIKTPSSLVKQTEQPFGSGNIMDTLFSYLYSPNHTFNK